MTVFFSVIMTSNIMGGGGVQSQQKLHGQPSHNIVPDIVHALLDPRVFRCPDAPLIRTLQNWGRNRKETYEQIYSQYPSLFVLGFFNIICCGPSKLGFFLFYEFLSHYCCAPRLFRTAVTSALALGSVYKPYCRCGESIHRTVILAISRKKNKTNPKNSKPPPNITLRPHQRHLL